MLIFIPGAQDFMAFKTHPLLALILTLLARHLFERNFDLIKKISNIGSKLVSEMRAIHFGIDSKASHLLLNFWLFFHNSGYMIINDLVLHDI